MTSSRFLLVFVDGLGLGPAGPNNPLAGVLHGQASQPQASGPAMPGLAEHLGSPLLADLTLAESGLWFRPIDACLGIPGLPQSATGQTTLYTGHNAAQFRGRHQSAFANGSLRQLIEPYGVFRQVMELGLAATQANAYMPGYFEAIAQRRRRYAVGALLNLTAPLPFRTLADYRQGEAVYWDITGDLVERYYDGSAISPQTAARRLLRLSQSHHFTLFETFLPDYAGHHQSWEEAIAALQRIDALLMTLIQERPDNLTVVFSSDHGNVEDLSTSHHTLNSVPLLVVGPAIHQFSGVTDLTGVTPAILRGLKEKIDTV